jgi:hypothetical protein
MPECPPLLRLVDTEAAHVLDVRAGRERFLAGTREDDDAGIGVAG